MHKIGLTGGIAAGKTVVSAILQEIGAAIIDADRLGHRTYERGTETFTQVVEAFGPEVVGGDGQIDRRVLGGKIFADAGARTRLTDIVWPGIRALAEADLRALAADGVEVAVLEAAVLIEAGWQDLVDTVWVITVPPAVACERLMERNGLSREDAENRIASQLSNAERIAHADVVLSTDCPLAEVRPRVLAEWSALRARHGAVENAAKTES